MNKIRLIADRETSFVYHVLSVARCGYDNAYGEKYRPDYPAAVLETLKKHQRLITVSGGEHCGALYGLMVGLPAQGKSTAQDFYREIVRQVNAGEVPEWGRPYASAAKEIAEAMLACYDHYVQAIWPEDQRKIEAYISQVSPLFENSDFTQKAEAAVGCALPVDQFSAVLVPSIQHGPEAIDISEDRDVFGIGRDPQDAFLFIGHEFLIYLLKSALRDEDAFRRFDTWRLTEALADHYLKQIIGSDCFSRLQPLIAFYEAQPRLSPVQLYRLALKAHADGTI